MRQSVVLITIALLGSVWAISAQPGKESGPKVFKVEFDVHDGASTDGPSKHYTMLIDESRKGLLQAGDRVAVAAGPQKGAHINLGTTIECMVREVNGKPVLEGSIEIARIVSNTGTPEAIINQKKLEFNSTLELGTPTVILYQRQAFGPVEATLTRMN